MADDWENIVIETGVDTLLDYLAEEDEAPVSEISEDLGVSEKRIKKWAEALEENGFVEKTYSARKGMVLHYTKQNKEKADQKLEEARRNVDERTDEVQDKMESKGEEIEEAKQKLQEMTEQLEEHREKEENLKDQLEKLEELENELEAKLESQEEKKEQLHSESVNLISRIDNTLEKIDEAEEKAEEFEQEEDEIKREIKALRKLEDHTTKVDELDKELKELTEKEEEAEGVFQSVKSKIGSLFGGSNSSHEEILEGNVEEVREKIEETDDLDYEKLLEEEINGKDRKTVKKFIERRLEG